MNDIIKLFFRFTILKMELNLEYFFYIYTKKPYCWNSFIMSMMIIIIFAKRKVFQINSPFVLNIDFFFSLFYSQLTTLLSLITLYFPIHTFIHSFDEC